MFTKILAFNAMVVFADALLYDRGHDVHQDYDLDHGHAVSSQSILRNDGYLPLGHIVAPAHYAAPLVHASPLAHYTAPIIYSGYENSHQDYEVQNVVEHDPARYEFGYSVADPHTGDFKTQHEARDGDVVHGSYSLLQPDGTIRKVEYTADDHAGFNAVVHNSIPAVYPEAAYHEDY